MDFNTFKNKMLSTFRLDLNSYKENQLKRRLDSLMARQKINDYGTFFQLMSTNRQAYEAFLDHLTINVSEFFRDPVRFKELQNKILPELIRKKGTLKIWSAACSIGAEPYSMVIILDELSPGKTHRLDATDIDKNILQAAASGRYSKDAVRNVSQEHLTKYFTRTGDHFLITELIKKRVSFRRHDLLTETFSQGYDLILCRNVTIYFTREAQDRINTKFAQALVPGGILFIGGSEMIFNYQELGFEKISPCFYKKKPY